MNGNYYKHVRCLPSIFFLKFLAYILQLRRENKLTKSSIMVTSGANQVMHMLSSFHTALSSYSGFPLCILPCLARL